MNMNFDDQYDPLCCCEYFDRNNERNHMLACCCNCVDFDQVFENFICCRPINKRQKDSMLLTMFDRIRVPWRGGAKLITADCVVPFLLIPILFFFAINNATCTILTFILMCVTILKANRYFPFVSPRGRFHFFWAVWSAVYLLLVFETSIPLYEFLPEENLLFVILFFVTIALFYRTREKSARHKFSDYKAGAQESDKDEDTKILISDQEGTDSSGRTSSNRVHRASHDLYYCKWIDTSVDKTNQSCYISGLAFAFLTFAVYANLTLTAVCHPYLLTSIFHIPISFPDDCSDIYELYDVAIGFVAGLYAIVVALVAVFNLTKYLVFILFARGHSATLRV